MQPAHLLGFSVRCCSRLLLPNPGEGGDLSAPARTVRASVADGVTLEVRREQTTAYDVSHVGSFQVALAIPGPGDSGGSSATTRIRPCLQTGQRRTHPDSAPSAWPGAGVTWRGSSTGRGTLKSWRQRCSFSLRQRLARNPKCRIRTKPDGSTWCKKRRMNSTASKAITFAALPCA